MAFVITAQDQGRLDQERDHSQNSLLMAIIDNTIELEKYMGNACIGRVTRIPQFSSRTLAWRIVGLKDVLDRVSELPDPVVQFYRRLEIACMLRG